jgi:acyl carrier protein
MVISWRTLKASPSRCTVCDGAVVIDSSYLAGDVPCPACGTLLWFVRTSQGLRLYDEQTVPAEKRLRIAAVVERLFADLWVVRAGAPSGNTVFAELGFDSLDVVELVMDLEEELGLSVPDEAAEGMHTLGDLIDWLTRCSP